MATSFNVNLTISSAVGFRRSSTQTLVYPDLSVVGGGVGGPKPLMTTTFTLEGVEQPDIAITGTRILKVSQPGTFNMYPGQLSDPQEIYITNEGNSPLSFVPPYVRGSSDGALLLPENVVIEPNDGSAPLPIPPGSTATLKVSYLAGDRPGDYYNWLLVII